MNLKDKAIFVVARIPDIGALAIVLGSIALLFTYTVPWVQPEYFLRWLPNAVHNGIHLTISDWFRGVDSASYDGGIRPRFISYSLTVLSAKFRLWVYDFFIPLPNLSIAFLITIVLTPFLYFKFSQRLLGNATAAFYATCLHLTSVGFISTTTFQYHQGKILVQPVVILLFILLTKLHAKATPNYFGEDKEDRKTTFAILALNFIGIAVDETYFVMACTGTALCYRIFWPVQWTKPEIKKSIRSLCIYFSPFFAFALFVLLLPYILPLIPNTKELFLRSGYLSYIGYLFDSTRSSFSLDWSLPHNLWLSVGANINTNYNAWGLMSQLPKYGIHLHPFIREYANIGLPLLLFALPLLAFGRKVGRAGVAINRALTQDRLLWGLPAALVIYFIFSTIVQQFHSKVTTGFFYGSMLSILLPLISVVLLLRWKHMPAFLGKLGLILIMLITVSNGLTHTVGAGYNHSKYSYDLSRGVYPKHTYPANPQVLLPKVQFTRNTKQAHFLWSPSHERQVREKMYSVWRKHKGDAPIDFSSVGPWDIDEYWFLAEMYYRQRKTNPHPDPVK
jgi:hypothetical protein